MGLSRRNRRAFVALIIICIFGIFELNWLKRWKMEKDAEENFRSGRFFRSNRRPPRFPIASTPASPILDLDIPRLKVQLDESAIIFNVVPVEESEQTQDSAVLISEIHYHPDEDQDASEFIEVTNVGNKEVDLMGWRFNNGIEFRFSSDTSDRIQPGQSIVLCRDIETFTAVYGKPAFALHNFEGALRNSGERLQILNSEDEPVDEIRYGDQYPWPEQADGTGHSLQRLNPNRVGNEPGNWMARQPNPGSYVLDPDTNPPVLVYDVKNRPKRPDSDDSIQITAEAQSSGPGKQVNLHLSVEGNPYQFHSKLNSDTTSTYRITAILPPLPDATLIRYAISITGTDEVDNNSAPTEDESYRVCFVDDRDKASGLPTYHLIMKEEDIRKMHYNPRSNQTYPVTFIADGTIYEGAKIRIRGAFARSWPKKAYKVFFKKDQLFNQRSRINFNSAWKDPAMIREVLAYHIYEQAEAYSLQSQPVRIEMNGQFWGMYIEVEQPEKHYLRGVGLKGSILYKADSNRNESDERELGRPEDYHNHYKKETHEEESFEDLAAFCNEIQRHSDSDTFFQSRVMLEKYINYLCATALTQNWDSFNKNHFIGKTGDGSEKWFILPWDLDRTLGDHWNWSYDEFQLPSDLGTRKNPGVTGWNRLADRFFQNENLRVQFDQRLNQLLQNVFTEEKMSTWIDLIKERISNDADADQKKWGSQGNWQTEIEALKSFVRNRRQFLIRELESRGFVKPL